MRIYLKFFLIIYLKSFFYVMLVMASLAFIMNLLSELDFFKNLDVKTSFPLSLSLLNTPDLIYEMFPFIFLVTTQLFFIKLFDNQEIEILKYSGFKNSRIVIILSTFSLIFGLFILLLFYNLSSNLKNIYLELKSNYATDGKYLAVITKNGLWIKDKIDNRVFIVNSRKINQHYLIDTFITEFDENFNVIRNIKTEKIDISNNLWVIENAKTYNKNEYQIIPTLKINTNFNYERIQKLYSNLSSLNIIQLYELKENYEKLNYSVTDVNLQIFKIFSLPLFLLLITIFSSIIMLKIKAINSNTFKISLGIFFSVIIYYINNFFHVLGSSEKISLTMSILIPLVMLTTANAIMLYNINEK